MNIKEYFKKKTDTIRISKVIKFVKRTNSYFEFSWWQILLLLIGLVSVIFIFSFFEDLSNKHAIFVELACAFMGGFVMAKYFFTKEKDLPKRVFVKAAINHLGIINESVRYMEVFGFGQRADFKERADRQIRFHAIIIRNESQDILESYRNSTIVHEKMRKIINRITKNSDIMMESYDDASPYLMSKEDLFKSLKEDIDELTSLILLYY